MNALVEKTFELSESAEKEKQKFWQKFWED